MSAGLPAPWWLVGLLVLAAGPLGWWLGRQLDTGGYRLADEWPDGAAPESGAAAGSFPAIARWAATVALPVLWGLLAWRLGRSAPGLVLAALPPYLLLAWLAVPLTWTDLDTHRLPEGLTLPAFPGMLLLLAVAAWTAGDWWALGRAVLAGAAAYVAYFVLAWAAGGAFGLGDVTVAALVALPLGLLGWGSVVVGFVVAHLIGGLVAVVVLVSRRGGRRTAIPFGPFILLGALVAVLAT